MTFRNLLVLTSCALVTLSMQAQTSTEEPLRTPIGGQDDLHHGGWGAPTTHYTRVMDKDALLVGLRGGWLINHRVTIGLAGQGLVTPIATGIAGLVAGGMLGTSYIAAKMIREKFIAGSEVKDEEKKSEPNDKGGKTDEH